MPSGDRAIGPLNGNFGMTNVEMTNESRRDGRAGRPRSVPFVAGFLFFATVAAILVGSSLLFPNPLMNSMWRLNRRGADAFQAMGSPAGYFLIVLGIATCAAGFGLLRGKRWAWWFAVVLFTVEITGDVVTYFFTYDVWRTVAGVLISGMFLGLMLQSSVMEWFGQKTHGREREVG